MSTMRRRLGTGPEASASTTPPAVEPSTRLLPVERVSPGQGGADVDRQAVAGRTGRRALGEGAARAAEGPASPGHVES
ncbi:hypothetical protein [Streptomyces griseoloalbus]|uniref:Uncharacterized protein n=1 Tax=Streptomyces griseoloalbus TaxID=67303 RepID=A0A7W8F970_9ACTN|nr:hypothetical protein [Streptomyces albaduncus]MBB5125116.1 hypothetical protein [Streptomyces albaduncus]GGV58718.1 hypothetical protein GCM10010294_06050 [Streptomyces griseoloalbus]GGW30039.1 hypothetical protein GCM10010340_04650 [Streptomyces albaduncus]